MINNKKYSLIENVEMIKKKANYLEEKAKEEEKFIELNGGAGRNHQQGEKMSNMLIDAIKAKLAILDSISGDN
jgi:hypothetical protein